MSENLWATITYIVGCLSSSSMHRNLWGTSPARMGTQAPNRSPPIRKREHLLSIVHNGREFMKFCNASEQSIASEIFNEWGRNNVYSGGDFWSWSNFLKIWTYMSRRATIPCVLLYKSHSRLADDAKLLSFVAHGPRWPTYIRIFPRGDHGKRHARGISLVPPFGWLGSAIRWHSDDKIQ